MTRAYGSQYSRRIRHAPLVVRLRDPSIHMLSFTCFQIVRILDRDPNEAPYAVVEVRDTPNSMGAFIRLPAL